jgi:hypothetical protein
MHLAKANGASSGSSDGDGEAELSAAGACDSRLATPDEPAPPAEHAVRTVTRSSPAAAGRIIWNITGVLRERVRLIPQFYGVPMKGG